MRTRTVGQLGDVTGTPRTRSQVYRSINSLKILDGFETIYCILMVISF